MMANFSGEQIAQLFFFFYFYSLKIGLELDNNRFFRHTAHIMRGLVTHALQNI